LEIIEKFSHFNGSTIKGPKEPSSKWVYDLIREFRKHLLSRKVMGDRFLGYDIARKGHMSCLWINEDLGALKVVRGIFVLEKTPYWVQKKILYAILDIPKMRKACIDNNGLGNNLAEDAQFEYGSIVEPVNMTNGAKAEMATDFKHTFEERNILIPSNAILRKDLHSVQKFTTVAGNNRFDAKATDIGHGDRFWAGALAVHAAKTEPRGSGKIRTGKKRRISAKTNNY